jgi:endonuclease/exonuclease/phosphatase family metal-dependent hydrolase
MDSRVASRWGWALRALAVSYVTLLVLVVLALRFVGERWWVTTIGLYLPRIGFALPLPPLAFAAAVSRRWRLLGSQAVAAVLVTFPLMGLHLGLRVGVPSPGSLRPGTLGLRVLSENIDVAAFGVEAILKNVRDADPDVVVFQETPLDRADLFKDGLAKYALRVDGQFLVASRYPIVDAFAPTTISQGGETHAPRFMRYRLATPVGTVWLYDVHPISPRDALNEVRSDEMRYQILNGRVFSGDASDEVAANTALRLAQLRAIAADAAKADGPVIIAGDTNLPGLSWALEHHLADYRDGFSEAGRGLGYTFPSTPRHHPWMRIDRILADRRSRFVAFRVSPEHASDHLAVIADLELSPPP